MNSMKYIKKFNKLCITEKSFIFGDNELEISITKIHNYYAPDKIQKFGHLSYFEILTKNNEPIGCIYETEY